MKSRIKGKFNFQVAGVLFVLSGLFELISITAPVPLFGDVRGGIVAATYHLGYAVLYCLLGFGLFRAKPWAYRLVFITTAIYSLDRLVYVLDKKALEIYLKLLMDNYNVTVGMEETEFILKAILVATIMIVICWWGLALYAYIRREYFHQHELDTKIMKPEG